MSRTTEPRPGQHAWFIRYISTADGWTPETVRGDVESRIETGWLLRVGGEIRELSDAEWSRYHP